MVVSGEVDELSHYPSLRKYNMPADFKFIILNTRVAIDDALTPFEQFEANETSSKDRPNFAGVLFGDFRRGCTPYHAYSFAMTSIMVRRFPASCKANESESSSLFFRTLWARWNVRERAALLARSNVPSAPLQLQRAYSHRCAGKRNPSCLE